MSEGRWTQDDVAKLAAMNQALRAMQKRGYTIQKAEQIFGLSQKIIRMHAHDMKLPPFRGDSL